MKLYAAAVATGAIMFSATCGAASETRQTLAATVIRGTTVYSPLDLLPTYRQLLGRPLGATETSSIIAAIEELYVRSGYSRPEIEIDSRALASGILQVNVFEASITDVAVSGNAGPHRARIDALAASLHDGRVVRPLELQSALRKIRDLPGLAVTAAIVRDESRRNAYVLKLDVEFTPVEGNLRVTNRGTEEVGPFIALGQATENGLIGMNERVSLILGVAQQPDEYRGAGTLIDLPIGSNGARGRLLAFRSLANPTEQGFDLPDVYVHNRVGLTASQLWQTTSGKTWSVTGGMDLDDLFVIRKGGFDLREDRLRIANANGQLFWGSGKTSYQAGLELRQGLNAFGAGLQLYGDPHDQRSDDFWIAKAQFVRVTQFGSAWSWRLDVLAQQSPYVLPDSERFKIGGERLGRGFDVPEIAGDQGVGGKFELRRDLPALSTPFGGFSAYGYYDFAATWKQDIDDSESAATCGVGLSLQGKRASGYLEVAKPLTHGDIEGKRETNVFLDLTMRF